MNGETYDPIRDGERLRKQLVAVRQAMADHEWHTLYALSLMTGAPEASVSARLRDLRKSKYGSYTVERRHVGNGLWEYRLLAPEPPGNP
jgi:hypothetical protein